MDGSHTFAACALAVGLLLLPPLASAGRRGNATPRVEVSILTYHRFGAVVSDAMTVRTATFRSQLDYLQRHHYPVVRLGTLTSYLLGRGPAPPPRAVILTVDDGHESVFTEMLPIVRQYRIPVTLFVYPSAISNASYAMTWQQLAALQGTGLFDIESHTYWHPNFRTERRRLSPQAYRSFVSMQFVKPRTLLRRELQVDAELLSWPFGIYDDELMAMAQASGYVAGFTLERRTVTPHDRLMALPRFLVSDAASSGRGFAAMLPQEPR